MGFSNPVLIGGGPSQQSVYEVATSARHKPGTIGFFPDGRRFEYVRSDQGTAIGKAKLATYEAMAAGSDQLAPAAAAIGATSISLTATLTLTLDELYGGFVSINDDAGEGELYGIIGNEVHTSGAGLVIQIDRPLVVALTTNTSCSIVHGSTSVKISAAVGTTDDPLEAAAGVPLVEIPIGSTTPQFAWVQKSGLATVLCGAVVGTVGQSVYQGALAGAFQQATLDIDTGVNIPSLVQLGTVIELIGQDTEYMVVRLNIV